MQVVWFCLQQAISDFAATAVNNIAEANAGLGHQGDAGWFRHSSCAPTDLGNTETISETSRGYDRSTNERIRVGSCCKEESTGAGGDVKAI